MSTKPPKVIAAPIGEPITVDECRTHLEAQRYLDSATDDADDAMIEGFLAAAREYCEDFLGLSLSSRTLEVALDQFPTSMTDGGVAIELPGGPVREIVQILAGDVTSASDNVLDPATYTLDTHALVARVLPLSSWPVVIKGTNVIRVQYLAGYGVDSDGGEPLPKVLRAAILLVMAHLFENREDSVDKAMATIPTGAEALMRPRRVRLGMA